MALAWIVTVPAQIFWAPTRAKLIAAARFIPGVWAVFGSSWSPGITRTPLVFQSIGAMGCSRYSVALQALILEECYGRFVAVLIDRSRTGRPP